MNYILFYQAAADVLTKAPTHYPAHSARLEEFQARGDLVVAGPFEDPQEGSMSIFTSREAANEFAQGDPFVLNGVVSEWRVRGWDVEPVGPIDR